MGFAQIGYAFLLAMLTDDFLAAGIVAHILALQNRGKVAPGGKIGMVRLEPCRPFLPAM